MEVCVTLGQLTLTEARKLKEAGVTAYNHNIDTSPEHYAEIVTTHTFQDRVNTIKAVQQAGMDVCCGGIIGLGETIDDRLKMLEVLTNFDPAPESVPVLTELRVKRGQHVKQGEIIAVLSDEAREAQVAQAEALVDQRKAELDAKRTLIASGTLPKLDLVNLESQYKAARGRARLARAERDRGVVRAPWAGVITDVPAEVGGAAFSMAGKEIATMVALDPMLAVVEVSERKLAGIKVGETAEVRLVTGQTVPGRVRYVSKIGEPDHAHLSRRGRDAQCRRRDSGRHHRGSRASRSRRCRRPRCRARR